MEKEKPKQPRPKKPIPNGRDRELWRIEDKEIQRYREGYRDVLNAYAFLNKIFFAGKDGMKLDVPIRISKKEYVVSAEEYFKAALPTILTEIAERLRQMGQIEYILDTNEVIKEDWREP